MHYHLEFFRQFRQRFKTTGSVLPSSRFLARAMTGPIMDRKRPARILEVGPGTGAVTQRIVRLMDDGDRFDLVEINAAFADILQRRFQSDPEFRRIAGQSEVHNCPIQDFAAREPYDYIISGLPLNNFSTELVEEVFDAFFRLLAPDGVLSYFEYMAVRSIRMVVGKRSERERIRELDGLLRTYLDRHRVHRDWVLCNLPPAWVQHLRVDEADDSAARTAGATAAQR